MATQAQLEGALKKAHQSGDFEAARAFANEIKRLKKTGEKKPELDSSESLLDLAKQKLSPLLPDLTPKEDAGSFSSGEAFAPLGRERTEADKAADIVALNALAGFGLPTKGLSAIGIEGPLESVESSKKILGPEVTALTEAAGLLPSSLLLPTSNILKAMGYGGGYGLLSGLGLSERGKELETAGAYGLLGAGVPLVGGALRGLAEVGRGAGSAALEMFKPAKKRAVERIVETMEAAGTQPKAYPQSK